MEANTPHITLLLGVLSFFGTVECPRSMVTPIINPEHLQAVSRSIIKSENWYKIAKKQPKLSASDKSSEYMQSISNQKSKSRSSSINKAGSLSPTTSFNYNEGFMTGVSDSDTESSSDDDVLYQSPSRSSSSNSPAMRDYNKAAILGEVTQYHSSIDLDQTNKGSCMVNYYLKRHKAFDGDAKMRLLRFVSIVKGMWEAVARDDCKIRNGKSWTGDGECQRLYGEFKKIPAEHRGACSTAISAQCSAVPSMVNPSNPPTACFFFVPTMRPKSRAVEGAFISLQDCVHDMKRQLIKRLEA